MDKIRDFMSRVVPWPAENGPGFINLHYQIDRKKWVARSFSSANDLLSHSDWANEKFKQVDTYFCLSQQKEKGKRKKQNALSFKSIWLDIDVKQDDKHYHTPQEALGALGVVRTSYGLPSPSAVVFSGGGGLHVYWIFDRAIDPPVWEGLSGGLKEACIRSQLKFDPGVTSDQARILRVPGTKHCKGEPKPVVLLWLEKEDYPVEAFEKLKLLKPSNGHSHESEIDQILPQRNTPVQESLTEGLEARTDRLLAWEPVFKECRFFNDAIVTGGKDHSEPLWHHSLLLCSFLDKGDRLAHRVSKGHKDYNNEATQEKFDRIDKERREQDIGWPRCETISQLYNGCETCPHKAANKTPLHLTATVKLPSTNPVDLYLPEGYELNSQGYISKIIYDEKTKESVLAQLFTAKFEDPWVQLDPDRINITVHAEGMPIYNTYIPQDKMSSVDKLAEYLSSRGVSITYVPRNKRHLEDFFVHWLAKIRAAQTARSVVSFGWFYEDGQPVGFAYAGTLWREDGNHSPCGWADPELRKRYGVQGKNIWFDLLKPVTDQNRPEAECLVACSFASPLFALTGHAAGTLSVYGHTGVTKTTLAELGVSVWGDPKKNKEGPSATAKGVTIKMRELKCLPLYWDELPDAHSQRRVFEAIFSATQGIAHTASTQSGTLRTQGGNWSLMMMVTANFSLHDYVETRQKTTDAGLLRVFEYELTQLTRGHLKNATIAQQMYGDMAHNYGHVGEMYSKLLASKASTLKQRILNASDEWDTLVFPKQEERFWVAICICILEGAKLANELGATFNIDSMRDFLVKAFNANRFRVDKSYVDLGRVDNVENEISLFCKQFIANTLWSDSAPTGPGDHFHPAIIEGPTLTGYTKKSVEIQFLTKDQEVRLSQNTFRKWLKIDRGIENYNSTADTMLKALKGRVRRIKMGGGTPFATGGVEFVMCIPIRDGTELYRTLHMHDNKLEKPNVGTTGIEVREPVHTTKGNGICEQGLADVLRVGAVVESPDHEQPPADSGAGM